MTSRLILSMMLAVALATAAGCRQPDGPMPQPQSDTANRIGDLSRDLMATAAGEADGTQNFVDDLKAFAMTPGQEAATEKLGRQVASATKGTKLSEQAAQQLAHASWTAVVSHEFSERQIESLRNDFKTQLTAIGAQPAAIDPVLNEVTETQRAVNTRPRRWYEFL